MSPIRITARRTRLVFQYHELGVFSQNATRFFQDGELGRFLKARSILVNASRAAAARSSVQNFGKGPLKMSFFPTLPKTSTLLYMQSPAHKSLLDLCVQTEQIYVEGAFEFSRT